ncbi:MAG: methyltransferase domain-containing protein [Elusimicrobiota bacterium]
MFDLSQRSTTQEIMDTKTMSIPEMERTLSFLDFTNRFFGGNRIILNYFERCSKKWDKNKIIQILDIGTGSGDLCCFLAQWAKRKQFSVSIVGIDIVPEIIQIAKKKTNSYSNISIQQITIFELIEKKEKFDYVIGNLLLHHIEIPDQIKFLQTLDLISQRGIVLSDLQRSWVSFFSIGFISYLSLNPIVMNDGPLSVRRAFTAPDLEELKNKSKLSYLQVKKEPWFRISLSGEKPHV